MAEKNSKLIGNKQEPGELFRERCRICYEGAAVFVSCSARETKPAIAELVERGSGSMAVRPPVERTGAVGGEDV